MWLFLPSVSVGVGWFRWMCSFLAFMEDHIGVLIKYPPNLCDAMKGGCLASSSWCSRPLCFLYLVFSAIAPLCFGFLMVYSQRCFARFFWYLLICLEGRFVVTMCLAWEVGTNPGSVGVDIKWCRYEHIWRFVSQTFWEQCFSWLKNLPTGFRLVSRVPA